MHLHIYENHHNGYITSFLRLMMRLAVYAKIENPGHLETAANAVLPGTREEIPDSKNNYLVNQLRGYGHEF